MERGSRKDHGAVDAERNTEDVRVGTGPEAQDPVHVRDVRTLREEAEEERQGRIREVLHRDREDVSGFGALLHRTLCHGAQGREDDQDVCGYVWDGGRGMNWFDVDKKGLGKLLEKRGFAFVLFELVQNALDTKATKVKVEFYRIPGSPYSVIIVEDDDPTGFKRLTDAWTLFAESEKKDKPELRGRFNIGEKLVLALCRTAKVESTTGTVIFDEDGRHRKSVCREKGSRFSGEIRCSNGEFKEACQSFETIIVPDGVELEFNGKVMTHRRIAARFEAALSTVIANEEGVLSRSIRKGSVDVYEPRKGEVGTLYELGIPVLETGDKWHVDVRQKIPLGFDRDNVPPTFLSALRAHVLNATVEALSKDEATEDWVTDALERKEIEPVVVDKVLDLRFGKKRAIFDPRDKEANNTLVSRGFTVLPGRTFSKAAWENVRRGVTKPSGKIAPTGTPYSTDPDAPVVHVLSGDEITPDLQEIRIWIHRIATVGIKRRISIRFVKTTNGFTACYGSGEMDINVRGLNGRIVNWKENGNAHWWLALAIHELAHEYESNHLSDKYHQACCDIGARIVLDPKGI